MSKIFISSVEALSRIINDREDMSLKPVNESTYIYVLETDIDNNTSFQTAKTVRFYSTQLENIINYIRDNYNLPIYYVEEIANMSLLEIWARKNSIKIISIHGHKYTKEIFMCVGSKGIISLYTIWNKYKIDISPIETNKLKYIDVEDEDLLHELNKIGIVLGIE